MPRHVDSIKCGACKERHTTVAQVQLCYQAKAAAADLTRREEFDAKVEAMAEQAAEGWFEERGGPVEDDRIEREAWAREDEARAAVAYAPHFHPGDYYECRIDHRAEDEARADVEIALKKADTLALLDRWKAANPGKQLNGYACTPYSRCNCPKSYSRCSAFAVLARFEAANPAPSFEPRGFSLGGSRRRQPW